MTHDFEDILHWKAVASGERYGQLALCLISNYLKNMTDSLQLFYDNILPGYPSFLQNII